MPKCKCKYHRVFECNDNCNPELIKLNLSVEILDQTVNFIITNESTKPICNDIVICSSTFGRYRHACDVKLFPQESITITANRNIFGIDEEESNGIEGTDQYIPGGGYRNANNNQDESIAFTQITDTDWVISNKVKSDIYNSWIYEISANPNVPSFRRAIAIANSSSSKSTAFNVNAFYQYFQPNINASNVIMFEGDDGWTIGNEGISFHFDKLEPGEIKFYVVTFPIPNPFNPNNKIVITSDTPFAGDLDGVWLGVDYAGQ